MIPSPDTSATFGSGVLLPLALLGYFLPGYFAFRRLGSALPIATAVVGSLLVLVGGVLLLDAAGIRVTLLSVGALVCCVSAAGWMAGRGQRPTFVRLRWPQCDRYTVPGWILGALALVSTVAFAVFDPLSGMDNVFRWNHLSLLVQVQGSLEHYPAISSADFRAYPWCDGIPPAVAIANLWIYLSTGSTYGGLIAGRIAVELGLTFYLVHRLATRLWGPRASGTAIGLLACSTLFLASVGTAQETALTGIALLTFAGLAFDYFERPQASTATWMALALAFAALCRDYNLLYLVVLPVVLLVAKAARRHLLISIGTMILVTAPWYLRNASRTGNPLYPQDLGGICATNGFHRDYMQYVQWQFGLGRLPQHHGFLLKVIAVGAGFLACAAVPGFLRRDRRCLVLALLVMIAVTLWALSVSSTAGGWVYSLRVLGPALPLLAIAGGGWATRLPKAAVIGLTFCVLPVTLDACRRSWIFLLDPLEAPLPYTWTTWRLNHGLSIAIRREDMWKQLAAEAKGEGIIADHPNFVIIGGQQGGALIPLFSPEAYPLTRAEQPCTARSVAAGLLANHVRFVVLREDHAFYAQALRPESGLYQLYREPPTRRLRGLRIYDVHALLAAPDPAPAQSR